MSTVTSHIGCKPFIYISELPRQQQVPSYRRQTISQVPLSSRFTAQSDKLKSHNASKLGSEQQTYEVKLRVTAFGGQCAA